MTRILFGILLTTVFLQDGVAQIIDQTRGVDAAVNYSALAEIGPWDDRNYAVNSDDILLLSENEAELSEAIPVFYRVLLRKTMPDLPTTGPVQYPRSALPKFLLEYGGYLVDGALYLGAQRTGNKFEIVFEEPTYLQDFQKSAAVISESRVTTPNGGAESAVAIKPTDPDIVVAGTNGPGSGQIMHYSTDGGSTWTESAALPLGGTCCDPTISWSSDGTLVYTATLGLGSGVWVYRSSDDGQTWTDFESDTPGDARRELGTASSDKEYLHVDTYSGSPYRDNVYLTWHQGNVMQFASSDDFGNTWASQAFSTASDDRGIGSDITTDKLGHIYYIWPGFNTQKIYLRKSSDGGATFDTKTEIADTEASFDFAIPSMETRRAFVYVSAASDTTNGTYGGSLYASWTDATAATSGSAANNHSRIQVAYSRDAGASWTIVAPHETVDANSVDRWHQWLAVGPDGTVHVVFYDTRNDVSRSSVDFYYTQSSDGAQTFSTPERLTSVTSPNITDTFEFGDYNGADIALNDLIGIYTDNRDESGGSSQSIDVYAAIVQPDPLPVEFVSLDALVDGHDIILKWSTESETNNSGFEIEAVRAEERSILGFVQGAGTSATQKSYEYRIQDPGPGKHIFRLRQVDSNGTFSYSPEIEIDVELLAAYTLGTPYPNPVVENAIFTFAVRDQQDVTIDVVDVLGRTVQTIFSGEMSSNQREVLEFKTNDLASGTYFVRAAGADFVASEQVVVVK